MVTAACLLSLATLAAEPDAAVKSALAKGDYPWYDAPADAVKPLAPPNPVEPRNSSSSSEWSVPGLGDLIVFVVMTAVLVALVALLAWAWMRFRPDPEGLIERKRATGTSSRVTSLPTGLNVDLTDPLGEARRLRGAGDYAGAIVCVFVHQLLVLDRMGQTRLAPGRTARQLVRNVGDVEARRLVEPTLRMFEAVYYGHQVPSFDAFESVWASAERFESWAAQGVTR